MPLPQVERAVELRSQAREVVAGDDHGLTPPLQPGEHLGDSHARAGVHGVQGPVEEKVPVLHERPGEEGALLLATGQLSDLAFSLGGEA